MYRCNTCMRGFTLNPIDSLCYGYNCLSSSTDRLYRFCNECPTYYKVARLQDNPKLTYCMPYFCAAFTPFNDICDQDASNYNGGHSIVSSSASSSSISFDYCSSTPNPSCTACSSYRYPSSLTQYGLCYPYNCVSKSEFNCEVCLPGFRKDSAYPGSCIAENCLQWASNGGCSKCQPPYSESASGVCQNVGCCLAYDSALGRCNTPKKYFMLQNGSCAPNNCQVLDLTRLSACRQCQTGYVLSASGTCSATNCQT